MKLLGLRTIIYPAPDLETTKQWYMHATGVVPYFDEPFYVGFNIGGYELGLDPNATEIRTYWGLTAEARQHVLEAYEESLDKSNIS